MVHDKLRFIISLRYFSLLSEWVTYVFDFIAILGSSLLFLDPRIRKNFLFNQGLDPSALTWFSASRLEKDDLKQKSTFEVIDNTKPKPQNEEPQLQTDRKKPWSRKSKAPRNEVNDKSNSMVSNNEDLMAAKLKLQKYSIILNNSRDGFWINDFNGKFIEVNNTFCKMIGYTREELLHMSVADIEVIGNFKSERRGIEEKIENGSDIFETKFKRKDGRIIDISISVNYNKEVAEDQLFVFLSDIAEEKNKFFNLSLEFLCIAGTDGYFKKINPIWTKVFGWTEEEFLTKPFFYFIHPEDIQKTIDAVSQLSLQNTVINFINRYKCKDGSYRWLSWASTPSNETIYAAAHDITDIKDAEEKIFKTMQDLEHSNKELEAFNKMAVDREKRMIELKRKINSLSKELGYKEPYDLSLIDIQINKDSIE